MPVGGKLVLKGGLQVTAAGVGKKPKKKKQKKDEEEQKQKEEQAKTVQGISVMSNNSYEQEFALEMEQARKGQTKSTPWGSTFREAPKILHGYDRKVKGKTAEERLDMRSAIKSDKFCK